MPEYSTCNHGGELNPITDAMREEMDKWYEDNGISKNSSDQVKIDLINEKFPHSYYKWDEAKRNDLYYMELELYHHLLIST